MNRSRLNGLKPLAGLLLFLPALSLADVRIEARRHFQNGMGLIARGSYDDGIAELKEAYAIKPHANVLYNIARAYLDAGRVPDALEYYRKYLATSPPDTAQVRASVAHLEETLAAREVQLPMPPPPDASKAPPASATPSTVDPEAAKKLNALMDRLERAVVKAEALNPGPVEAPAKGTAASSEASSAEEVTGSGEAVPYEEQVVTASRRAQSTLEAPNATTVITGEEIRLSGATTLVDVLRRVPGAEVMVLGVGSANVSLRGFNQRLANKVLVLLDGRTEYQDFLGLTIWSAIPVGLEEIDRIEVIRGPGSALYGANAMLGVINIITRAPGTGTKAEFNARLGSGNTGYGSFVASSSDKNLKYRASAAFDQADKWSRDFDQNRPDVQSNAFDPNLGLRSGRGNLTAIYTFSPQVSVGASGGVNRLFTEIYPIGLLRNYFFDGVEAYTKADVAAGPMKFKFFWNNLTANAGPEYSPAGQSANLVTLNSNVFNGEALYQQDFDLFGKHRLNLGAEGRLKRVFFSYLDGPHSEFHASLFVQDEWRIVEQVRIQASYRVDRAPLLNAGKPGYAQSPRISAVWIPVEGQAFRAGVATAFREPTFLESYTDVRIPVPGINGASALTQGDPTLRPEQLTALEVGYRGDFPTLGLEWDLAAYQNFVSNLISLSSLQRLPADQSYDPVSQTYVLGHSFFQNEPAVYIARGLEIGAKFSPIDGLDIRASTALQSVTSDSAQVCASCTQAPGLKLYGSASYRSKANIDLSVEAAYVSSTVWVERQPSPSDPTQVLALQNPLSAYAVLNARIGYRMLQDKLVVALTGSNLGAPHQEHPFGNFITQRFLGTVTVTP